MMRPSRFLGIGALASRRLGLSTTLLIGWVLMPAAPGALWGQARADVKATALASWPVVIARDAIPAERHAAAEFRDLVAGATGIRPEIGEGSSPSGPATRIGKAAGLDVADLGDEGFRIKISSEGLAIEGGGPRGTLYGVYTFLEDQLGVRFLAADATHVPKAAPGKVISDCEKSFRPRFSWRESYYNANRTNPELAAHLRINTVSDQADLGGRSSWSLISHSVDQYVPVARFGKEHPEYFSLVDGKRRGFMKEDHFDQGGTQPCFTNTEVKHLLIDGILGRLDRAGQTDGNISISQNDNTKYCRCDRCRAIDEAEESNMGALLTLLNEAGNAVAKVRPGVFVGTLAYQFSRKPPRSLRPHPNVAIQLCSIEACQIHPLNDPACPKNVEFCRDLEGWCRICKQVYVWNYNTNFACYNGPCPNLEVIGPNVKFLAAHGVRGVFMQAAGDAPNTELSELRNYLIARMLWDPTSDDRKLTEEFVRLYYGKAAPRVREYLTLILDSARKSGIHRGCFGSAGSYGIDASVAKQALKILDEGMKLADDEAIRRRVEKVTIAPRLVLIEPFVSWLREHRRTIRNGNPLPAPPDTYRGSEGEIRTLFALFERHGVTHYAENLRVSQVKEVLPPEIFSTR